jgi:hypothetical protein
MGGRYDVWLENLIMPEMAARTSFKSPACANKSSTKPSHLLNLLKSA